jgi:uncharacterized protein (DUF2267 family)
MRRAIQVRVTMEVLTEALGLPAGDRVSAVLPLDCADLLHGTVRLVIEGDGYYDVPEGCEPPMGALALTKKEAEA